MIGDLVDYAAMQSGILGLNRQPLSLHALVREVAALWREQLAARELQLDLRLEASADQIMGDHDRLEQVIWNLLYHAERRSPANGSITFRTSNPGRECVTLEVRDTGKHMDAESIAWAFSPFECVSRMGERGKGEVGLGLAVSRGIVEAHGGSVRIQSTPQGLGASVIVQLPVMGRPKTEG